MPALELVMVCPHSSTLCKPHTYCIVLKAAWSHNMMCVWHKQMHMQQASDPDIAHIFSQGVFLVLTLMEWSALHKARPGVHNTHMKVESLIYHRHKKPVLYDRWLWSKYENSIYTFSDSIDWVEIKLFSTSWKRQGSEITAHNSNIAFNVKEEVRSLEYSRVLKVETEVFRWLTCLIYFYMWPTLFNLALWT